MNPVRKIFIGYQFMRLATKLDNLMRLGSDEEYTEALNEYKEFVIRNDLNTDEHHFCEVIRRELPGLKEGLKGHPDDQIEVDFKKMQKIPYQFLKNVGFQEYHTFRNRIVVFSYSSNSKKTHTKILETTP